MSIDGIRGGFTPSSLEQTSSADLTQDTKASSQAIEKHWTSPGWTLEQMQEKLQPKSINADLVSSLPAPEETPQAPSTALAHLGSIADETQVQTDIYAFLALFQKMAQEMRNSQRTIRAAEAQAQTNALLSAADQMKEAASERFKAALTQGLTQIGGGLLQIASASMSFSKSITASKEAANAEGLSKTTDFSDPAATKIYEDAKLAADTSAASVKRLDATSKGAEGLESGIGGIASAGFTAKAAEADATHAKLEAIAKTHDTASQQANDMMQQMQDIIRDVRDKLQSMQQSAVETNRGIARNI